MVLAVFVGGLVNGKLCAVPRDPERVFMAMLDSGPGYAPLPESPDSGAVLRNGYGQWAEYQWRGHTLDERGRRRYVLARSADQVLAEQGYLVPELRSPAP